MDNTIVAESTESSVAIAESEPSGDPRLRNLSYSSILNLHVCPRLYELTKLQASRTEEEDVIQSITFAFGHAVGTGIQSLLQGHSIEHTVFQMFLAWDTFLWIEDDKKQKSFAYAVFAVRKFAEMRSAGLLDGYELYYHDGKPAVELSFCITFPDGFRYRGFVDAVLQHKHTGKVLVLEVKTTGSKWLHEAMYQNSAQAIGYSIVLDTLFSELSEYDVQYMPYLTTALRYEPMLFSKSYMQRALWIKQLLLDIDIIKMYEQAQVFPMYGESCMQYMRPCKFFGTCTMSNSFLTEPYVHERDRDKTEYQINLTVHDLIESQIRRIT